MTNEFISFDILAGYPEEDRHRIRDYFLRGNRIALAVEDYNIDLDVLSDRSGISLDLIDEVINGHILEVDEATIRAIEDAVADIIDSRK
ncbi:hypothetical protein [Agrobacterium tumefaciens]|uniref:hypothetical protein n=1 Tax=Agrobacterium tumefaciens TaxID=358 RepID=UPI0028655084|nr:hypothetical protein [Agrobacterium tumefaciens]MDR6587417.1 hypothetical protein [Agrobacterium tumefaciens]